MKKKSNISVLRKKLTADNMKQPIILTPVPKESWPDGQATNLIECWRSRFFLVQVYDETNGAFRVSICRPELRMDGEWRDGITWEELMQIKREIGRHDAYAVEVLPPDQDIVNVANLRHFWILPKPIIGWKNK